MANTYTLISSNTLSATTATVTFSGIPATYTDLVLQVSARSTTATVSAFVTYYLNSNTGSLHSETYLGGGGSATESGRASNANAIGIQGFISISGASATANTFGSVEIYIPSYAASQNKPTSNYGVAESNTALVQMGITAGLWRNTAAVTSITLDPQGDFASGSSFYLYGIKNS